MGSRLEHYGAMETQNEPLQIRATNKFLIYFLTSVTVLFITYLFTSRSRILPEKLTGLQLVKKFLAFSVTRKFVTAFASAHYKWISVTMAWRVLRLRMEERPPIWRGSCEYFE
jgi:hypothetical protein